MQRGRDFSRFEDLDDRYDLRPSAWVTPKGEWGKGSVELVEIPTNDETNDNIVAYWTPDQLPEPGKEMNSRSPSPSAVMKTNCMRQITHGCNKRVVQRGM